MSSDGLRHEGEINAPDKDSAYAELRKRGIRAIRVTERIVPIVRRGFKGLRKRDLAGIAAVLIVVAVLVGFGAVQYAERSASRRPAADQPVSAESITSDPEMQEEVRRVLEERKQIEEECRKRIAERVEKGTLSLEEANGMLQAMGMKNLANPR